MALASSSRETVDPQKKIILITGVSQGLGRALALEFAKDGHVIAGCSRNANKLDSLHQQLIKASPSNHLLFNIDVKSDGCIKEMAHTIMEKIGAPDIIINNAAVYHDNLKIWEVPDEEFDYVIDVNVKGTANVLRHFIPLMIAKNKGIIVNISSIYGRTGAALASVGPYINVVRFGFQLDQSVVLVVGPQAREKHRQTPVGAISTQAIVPRWNHPSPALDPLKGSAYSASKWAIEGLTKSVAKELGDGMTIVALDPGIINTEMLAFRFGNLASQYQSPKQWASKAALMILNLTSADNGASLIVDDPGILPC